MSDQNKTTATTRKPGGPMRGGPMGHMSMMKGDKAHDFKSTMVKLIEYLGSYKTSIVIVMIFAVASTIFNIAGPKILV